MSVRFGKKVCSACQGDIQAICTLANDSFPWLPSEKMIEFYVGDVAATLPPEPKVAVVWGSCAVTEARTVPVEEGERCVFVPGCPPDPVTCFEAFEKLRARFE